MNQSKKKQKHKTWINAWFWWSWFFLQNSVLTEQLRPGEWKVWFLVNNYVYTYIIYMATYVYSFPDFLPAHGGEGGLRQPMRRIYIYIYAICACSALALCASTCTRLRCHVCTVPSRHGAVWYPSIRLRCLHGFPHDMRGCSDFRMPASNSTTRSACWWPYLALANRWTADSPPVTYSCVYARNWSPKSMHWTQVCARAMRRSLPYHWGHAAKFLNQLLCAGYAPGPRQGLVPNFGLFHVHLSSAQMVWAKVRVVCARLCAVYLYIYIYIY